MALERGDVDAWAGPGPMMADVELSAVVIPLFYRNADANTLRRAQRSPRRSRPSIPISCGRCWRSTSAAASARWPILTSSDNILATAAKLPEPVAAKQLERTQFVGPQLGAGELPDCQQPSPAGSGPAGTQGCRRKPVRRRWPKRRTAAGAVARKLSQAPTLIASLSDRACEDWGWEGRLSTAAATVDVEA